jgi:NAD+ synthetase
MITDYKSAVENIRNELKNYLINSGLKALVLGVSGGIDSCLTAALARPVCDELGLTLYCRSITIQSNKADEILRARQSGEAFGHDFKERDLSAMFEGMIQDVVEDYESQDTTDYSYKIRQGNVKARIRMLCLYDLASKHRGMVLSTDNYTELLLGFWTLHGDVGDYGMIQNLWKTEVYAMAEYLAKHAGDQKQSEALSACINAVPTDGLGITDSDLDQIGAASYQEVDQLLIEYLKNPTNPEKLSNKVVQRKLNSEFKRHNPFNIPREKITETPFY